MADVKWIKIVVDIFDDEKMQLIDSYPDRDAIIVIWFKLLCLAGKQNNGGIFMINDRIAYTDEMLAIIFRRPIATIRLALRVFLDYGMIEIIDNVITIPNWEKHQSLDKLEKQKESRKETNRRYYEKKKQERIEDREIKTSYKTDSDESLRHLKTPLEEEGEREEDKKYISPSPEPATAAADEIEAPPKQAKILSAKQERRFAAFWEHYPKKVGKQDAQRAWKRIDPDDEMTDRILHAVEEAKAKDSRFREERYTPHPASWLNAGSWEDEFTAYGPSNGYQRDPESSFDVDEFMQAAEQNRRTP